MEFQKRYLPWLASAAAAAVAIPAFAYGDPGSRGSESRAPGVINAIDYAFENPATGDSGVTINAGETVTFAYPTGADFHNVKFSAAAPTSCVQTAGTDVGAVPPLPAFPVAAGWSGRCTFNTPGTFEFHCEAHTFMTGVVTVLPNGNPTPSPTPTPTPTPRPTPTPTPTPTPLGAAASELKLARNQRGQAVQGSIVVARAGSRISVKVLAKRSALGRKGRTRIRVGSTTKTANAGTADFSVTLNRAARKALARRGRLALTVRIAVTPASGTPFRATKTVKLKRPTGDSR